MTDRTTIRPLQKEESIPFDLLLLADEELQAIEKYIYRCEVCVAETEGRTTGVYALYPIDKNTAEIKAIAVDTHSQNKGIGKLMLKDAETRAKQKGFSKLIIGTPTVAEKQLRIYQKAGFELFGIRKDFFIIHYTEPIFEEGIQLTDMAMLRKLIG